MVASFRIDNKEYVVISRDEYQRLTGGSPSGLVAAAPFMARSIGRALRSARLAAKLTQSELAAKLGKSQAMVSAAENGRVRTGERFTRSVLRACGLPPDWKPPAPKLARKPSPR